MGVTARSFALGLALCACSGEPEREPAVLRPAPIRPEPASSASDPNGLLAPELPPPRSPAVEQAPSAPAAARVWRITSDSVGPLKLGGSITEPAAGFAATYRTSFYADAQPLEGFALDDPPVLAVVAGGPFSHWGQDHPGDAAPADVKQRAVELARTGKLTIGMIIVTDPRPKTEREVGVGDSYASFARAYEDLKPSRFPGLWEEPSCVASQATRSFFFDRCDALEGAKLIRIVLMPEDEEF